LNNLQTQEEEPSQTQRQAGMPLKFQSAPDLIQFPKSSVERISSIFQNHDGAKDRRLKQYWMKQSQRYNFGLQDGDVQ
jgi:hypothetical protein